jgi:hypothetical protein
MNSALSSRLRLRSSVTAHNNVLTSLKSEWAATGGPTATHQIEAAVQPSCHLWSDLSALHKIHWGYAQCGLQCMHVRVEVHSNLTGCNHPNQLNEQCTVNAQLHRRSSKQHNHNECQHQRSY